MSMCNVVAVLEQCEKQHLSTFETAVELADRQNARLTLVKTCESTRGFVWLNACAIGTLAAPLQLNLSEVAARQLALVAETVPSWIPLTTLLLGNNTQKSLSSFLDRYLCDALVIGPNLLVRRRRLRQDLQDRGLQVLVVHPHTSQGTGDPAYGEPEGLRRASESNRLAR